METQKKTKYIFVCGGVMSGVGKGVTTASIGSILQAKGFEVALMKADPYLNVDAGTMNPKEHGEVFVLDNGLETDQDMGNYERFLGKTMPDANYMTNGMIFKSVIDRERSLGYKGKCVEFTYHITEEIITRFDKAIKDSGNPDVLIVEIGGTIGEYQNAVFLEAARKLRLENPLDVMFVMVSYLPAPPTIGEMKTKPTQNAVRQLNSFGVHPDMIIARAEHQLTDANKVKLAAMTGIQKEHVISAPDAESIYDVPLNFEKDSVGQKVVKVLGLLDSKTDLSAWSEMVQKRKSATDEVKIAVVGKYFATDGFVLSDVYISILEAVKSAAIPVGVKPVIDWVPSPDFENGAKSLSDLDQYDAVLVPGGFGKTGIEGKISVIQHCRENKIPYFGICYGMQLLVIEYARNVLGISGANTEEITPDGANNIVGIMPDQKKLLLDGSYGGTMRLGSYPAVLKEDTVASRAYGALQITERHRHRFEVQPQYIERLEQGGLVFSGKSPDGTLMEIAEIPQGEHPFMVGVQFHPEFMARPLDPHPLFVEFLKAAKSAGK